MNLTTRYIALAVAVILVAGAFTLPFAFDGHSVDAKSKHSKNKHSKHSSSSKKNIEFETGPGGDGGNAPGGSSGTATGGAGRRC